MAKGTQPKTGRNKNLVQYKLNGMTFKSLAAMFNISPAFAKRIYYRDRTKYGYRVDKKIKKN